MNDIPPSNSWNSTEACADAQGTSPAITYGVTITGVPAVIAGAANNAYIWSITLNDGAGNFSIDHYDDTGALIDHPIFLSGADGSTQFGDPVYLSRDPLLVMEAATKGYVDDNSLTGQEPPQGPAFYGRQNVAGVGSWVNLAAPTLGYLPLGGGYLTGAIGFNGPVTQRLIGGVTPSPGNLWRWGLALGDNTAESGGNAGSNFVLTSYNDAGTGATAQLTIDRAGNTTFSNNCVFPSQAIVNGRLVMASPVNLQIGGGASGDTLLTDGFGNLAWGAGGTGGGVPEAPLTGGPYGRQTGGWVTIPAPVITTDAPAVSQLYGRYNNGWVQVGQQFLALAGGTMAGPIIFNAAGANRALAGQASNVMRWAEYLGDSTTESGGNSGSNFSLVRYSDAGAIIDTPLSISRQTGQVNLADGATVPTPAPTDSSLLVANTAWVKAAIASGASITVGDTPPASPASGALWFDSVGGQTYLWYVDPTSSQWVPVVNQQGAYLPLSGGALSGPLNATGAGTVTVPTPSAADNSANAATTAWVNSVVPTASLTPPLMAGVASAGSSTQWSRGDHAHPTDTTRLAVAGGTMTGALLTPGLTVNSTVGGGTPTIFNGPSGSYRGVQGQTGGVIRWSVYLGNNAAETGSNVGSDFAISRYNDAGTSINTPFTITRSNGAISLTGPTTVSAGTFTVASGNVSYLQGGFTCAGAVGAVNNVNSMNYGVTTGLVTENTNNPALYTNKIGGNGIVQSILQGGVSVGSISVANGNSTAFNTTSDVRLKRDERSFDAGPILDATEVYDFEWINSPGVRAYGVMAQEANEVFPDAVHHEEDSDTWGVDYSKYVPLLLNEIKALRARVAVLEAAR